MSIELCTQCERNVDMDWNGGEYLDDKFYCEGCIFDCDCGKTIPTNEAMCQTCHVKGARS